MIRLIAVFLVVLPGMAYAHASERMVILTLPTGWYMVGAAIAVVLTALLSAFAARPPKFPAFELFFRPAFLARTALNWIGTAVFAVLIGTGVWGTHDPAENLLPLMLWTMLWVGLTLLAVLFGDLWRKIEPWSGPVRLLRHLLGRKKRIGLSRLGYWPAVLGYLGFAWFEIVSLAPADPPHLARVAVIYYVAILVLAVAEGEEWLRRGEFLSVYFGFISKIAPLWGEVRSGGIMVMAGPPGAQVLRIEPLAPSAIAFVTLVLASVSFDGLSETFWWLARLDINPLEFPGRSAVLKVNSVSLIIFWGISTALILGAVRLGLPRGKFREAIGPMMLAFLPIAAGYHVAHYLVAFLTDGQYLIAAINDPLGKGWHLLGLSDHWVSFGFLSTRTGVLSIWAAQFSVILAAHLLAVILGFRLGERAGVGPSLWAHLPVTILMVGYTVFGLWLLSAPTAG